MQRAGVLMLFVSFGGCDDTNGPDPMFPTLVFPGSITVTEAGSATFLLRLSPPPSSDAARGLVTTLGGELTTGAAATIVPSDFHMSPANYPAVMTIYGVDDSEPGP